MSTAREGRGREGEGREPDLTEIKMEDIKIVVILSNWILVQINGSSVNEEQALCIIIFLTL
jgi:hypothetical protein